MGRWRRRSACGVALLLLLVGAGTAAAAEAELRIGKVTLGSLDVYSQEEAARGWVYRTANRLHRATRVEVIRRFLLFAEGDVYDPEVLAQTERNLRELPFVKSASVTATPAGPGLVDVEVVTQDSWTTGVGGALGSEGGRTVGGVEFSEKNLLGLGFEMALEWDREADRTQRQLELHDPYLLGRYFRGDFVYSYNSDGSQRKASIARPFYALNVPWAMVAGTEHLEEVLRLYRDGSESARFRHRHVDVGAEYGRAVAREAAAAVRLVGGVRFVEDSFSHVPSRPEDVLPTDRDHRYVYGRLLYVEHDYLKLDYVNRDLRVEDFNLGRQASLLLGLSPELFGAPRTTGLLELSVGKGRRLGERGFLLATAAFETRLDGGLQNAIAEVDASYVRKMPTRLKQTFVSRLVVRKGHHLDGEIQFAADGQTGLRGYELHRYTGDDAVILNLEHRMFAGRELFQLLSPGLAVFIDTGTATPVGRSPRLGDLHTDVGVGLRLGIARASTNNMLRMDVAYPFDPDPDGERDVLISFSSGQSF